MELRWSPCETPVWSPVVQSPVRHQHPLHAEAERACGRASTFYALTLDGRVSGAALVGLRHWPLWGRFAVLGRGPVWAEDVPKPVREKAVTALLERLRQGNLGVLAAPDPIGGEVPHAGSGWLPVMTEAHVAILSLRDPLEVIRARQSGKWRNRLRRAEMSDLRVEHGRMPVDPGHWLLRREAEQRRARRYRGASFDYTLGWIAAGGPRSAGLFTALADGRVVAAMLFLLHPPGASYHIGWSNAEGRASNAHPLLLWSAITWLKRKGYEEIDLDVIDTENAPGLARFKLGSGARPVAIGPTRLSAPGTGLLSRLAP